MPMPHDPTYADGYLDAQEDMLHVFEELTGVLAPDGWGQWLWTYIPALECRPLDALNDGRLKELLTYVKGYRDTSFG